MNQIKRNINLILILLVFVFTTKMLLLRRPYYALNVRNYCKKSLQNAILDGGFL